MTDTIKQSVLDLIAAARTLCDETFLPEGVRRIDSPRKRKAEDDLRAALTRIREAV